MSFFSSRRSIFLNIAILFIFLGSWIFSYLSPALKGLLDEDYLLRDFASDDYVIYGTVSRASIPSVFGGSNIPFLDKVNFQINSDDSTTFVLYASQEIMDEMSEWFSFGSVNAGSVPLEIMASRIDEKTFVVHAMSSTDGDLDFETLTVEYQFYYAFIYVCIIGVLGLTGFIFLVLWLFVTRPKKKVYDESDEGDGSEDNVLDDSKENDKSVDAEK